MPVGIALCTIVISAWVYRDSYWGELVARAFSDSWLLVFEKNWAGTIILVVLWLGEFWREHGCRWREMKPELSKLITSLSVPAMVLLGVFCIHLFGATPRALTQETLRENLALKRERTEKPAPVAVTVRSENEDKELRKRVELITGELTTTRQVLVSTSNELASTRLLFDPKKQSLAAATFSIDVIISTAQQLSSHFMDQGATVAIGQGNAALLIAHSVDSHGVTVEPNKARFWATCSVPDNDPSMGKPIHRLSDGEYVQLEFGAMEENAVVQSGKATLVLNNQIRIIFDIPAQTAKGKRIFVRKINETLESALK